MSLDGKLLAAMQSMLQQAGEPAKTVLRQLKRAMVEFMKDDQVVQGHHAVFLLIDSFRSLDESEIYYGVDHLGRLEMHNNDLEEFVCQWEHIVDNESRTDSVLCAPFFRKIREHPDLSLDVREFERMRVDDYKHSTFGFTKGSR
jgi:hypothetical protein